MLNRTTLIQKAGRLCGLHRCEEAIAELEEILGRRSDNPEIHFLLGFCYSGGCRAHTLSDPDIALEHLRRALLGSRGDDDAVLQSRILAAMGNAYLHSSLIPHGRRVEAAVECLEKAAVLLGRLGNRDGWAREQYNLGNAWCEATQEKHPGKWRNAIRHYENALEVRTKESSPERHAAILQNLGTAYRELVTGDRRENLSRSIRCYRRALRIYTSRSFPLEFAALHNNLANSFLTLGYLSEGNQGRNALRALRHLALALAVWTPERHPCKHALARFNSGNAHVLKAACETLPLRSLRRAAVCFNEAARLFRACGETANARSAHARFDRVLSCLPA